MEFEKDEQEAEPRPSNVKHFFRAIAYNNLQQVATVLAKNTCPMTETYGTKSLLPLHLAAKLGRVAVMKLLIDKTTPDLNAVAGPNSVTPLILACLHGHTNVVKLLLSQKPTIDLNISCDSSIATPTPRDVEEFQRVLTLIGMCFSLYIDRCLIIFIFQKNMHF